MPKSKGNKRRRKDREIGRLRRKYDESPGNSTPSAGGGGWRRAAPESPGVITLSPPANPDDPCPNGHPDQLADMMFHGIAPRRCPRCGETPQFGGMTQNGSVTFAG